MVERGVGGCVAVRIAFEGRTRWRMAKRRSAVTGRTGWLW